MLYRCSNDIRRIWGEILMEAQKKEQTSEEELVIIEETIGKILRFGVLVSALIILAGIITYLITNNSGYKETFPTSFKDIFIGVAAFKPFAIIMLGLFCLILTPILRVGISCYAFYKEKDWLYVGITAIVLIILFISFLIGYTS